MESLAFEVLNGPENNNTGFNLTEVLTEGDMVFAVMVGLSCVIMLVGIPGNLLVIASVIMKKELRSAPNFLVLSLSVCYFLFLSIPVPVHIYTYFTGHPPASDACWAIGFITNWLLGSSVLSTGAIAINRYIAVVLKSKYHQISGNGAVAITYTCDFLLPFRLISPSFFDKTIGNFGFESLDRSCGFMGNGILRIVLIAVVSTFPVIFMTLCYIRIFLYVTASRRRVDALGRATALGTARSTETRLTIMLAMVYIVYLVTTLPALFVNAIAQTGVFVPEWLNKTCFTFVWMSSAANPVVHGLVNRKYRDAYKSVVTKICNFTIRRRETESLDTNTR
ncbi:melatonin receptor type 1B-like [Liolophura sinensis]|uniref:melatonin receptor type 1B-like n=1 Tax=Liolophura sinensis TaxID=3198878 RepID=UPI0031581126